MNNETPRTRIAWRLRRMLGSGPWRPVFSALGGFGLGQLVPVRGWWLPGVVAVGCVLAAAGLLVLGERFDRRGGTASVSSAKLGGMDTAALLEHSNAAQQIAFAFGASAMLLAGFCAGVGLSKLV